MFANQWGMPYLDAFHMDTGNIATLCKLELLFKPNINDFVAEALCGCFAIYYFIATSNSLANSLGNFDLSLLPH